MSASPLKKVRTDTQYNTMYVPFTPPVPVLPPTPVQVFEKYLPAVLNEDLVTLLNKNASYILDYI